jgi:diacylglycerol kinase (ATP)
LKGACDVVIAAGGDGTIGYVFTHLADRSIPLGVLPLGSANNIARSAYVSRIGRAVARRHVHSFHLVEVTYGKDKKELCTEGFGVGLMAALIKRRAKGKKADGADDMRRGRRALAALVSDAGPLDLEINIDGKPWKSDLISVDVLDIPFTGPALPHAHSADPGDTLLDVIGFESDKRDELIEWIKSPQEEAPPVSARRGEKIEIRWRDADSRLDDEVVNGRDRDAESGRRDGQSRTLPHPRTIGARISPTVWFPTLDPFALLICHRRILTRFRDSLRTATRRFTLQGV